MAEHQQLTNGKQPSKKRRLEIQEPVTVVLGSQFGDEGKGKVVDMLAGNVDIVCRCQVSESQHWTRFQWKQDSLARVTLQKAAKDGYQRSLRVIRYGKDVFADKQEK